MQAHDQPLFFERASRRAKDQNDLDFRSADLVSPIHGFGSAPSTTAAEIHDFDQYLEAQELERLRMGRELHDSTGQLLLALTLSLASLRTAPSSEDCAAILGDIDEMVGRIDHEIRTFAFIHYPPDLADRDFVGALQSLARGFGKRTGLHVTFRGTCAHIVSRDPALALLRIAQEALTNVHRHAHAKSVEVLVAEQHGRFVLRIRDDGVGIGGRDHPATGEGIGVRGMAHRIERLGGHLAIRRLKHGTMVTASLPSTLLAA